MLFIRPVSLKDLQALLHICDIIGGGMSTMPRDAKVWESKIADSIHSFSNPPNVRDAGSYFLVAEDSETGQVVGTTAIYVGIGTVLPFFSYKLNTLVKHSRDLGKTVEIKVLNLVNDFTRATEIGSLYLDEAYRYNGYGQFMSRARYLLMSDFPERISDDVIAEMRGWLTPEGYSPFWRALGKKFFNLPFEYASGLSAIKGNQFIQDLIPKYPVYVDLLTEEAQQNIGRPHDVSARAVRMLEKEGFRYDGYVDVFDAGPVVHCRREQIQSVRDAKIYTAKISNHLLDNKQRYLISNRHIDNYRIIVQPANLVDDVVEITAESAEILGVTSGDSVNLFAMKEKSKTAG